MPPCFGSAAYAALQIVVKAKIATANAHALRMLSSPFVSALPRLALPRLALFRLALFRLALFRLALFRLALFRLALFRLALFRLGRLAATIAIGGGRSNPQSLWRHCQFG